MQASLYAIFRAPFAILSRFCTRNVHRRGRNEGGGGAPHDDASLLPNAPPEDGVGDCEIGASAVSDTDTATCHDIDRRQESFRAAERDIEIDVDGTINQSIRDGSIRDVTACGCARDVTACKDTRESNLSQPVVQGPTVVQGPPYDDTAHRLDPDIDLFSRELFESFQRRNLYSRMEEHSVVAISTNTSAPPSELRGPSRDEFEKWYAIGQTRGCTAARLKMVVDRT